MVSKVYEAILFAYVVEGYGEGAGGQTLDFCLEQSLIGGTEDVGLAVCVGDC